MTKSSLKTAIHQAIDENENQYVLELVYSILRGDGLPSGKRISKKQYNKELQASMEQIKKGKTYKHSAIEKEVSKW
jgi:hypothetical protein